MRSMLRMLTVIAGGLLASAHAAEPGFTTLFDGKTLNGWKLMNGKGGGYYVTNGVIAIAKGGGGNLMTEKEYGDFVLRFEFKLDEGSNNGLGIRAPLQGDAAYAGMELQIIDDDAADKKYGKLRPEQYHGSIYDVVPAKKGALKPAGQWNEQEVSAQGRKIMVKLNGQTILDADLNAVKDPVAIQKHPGLFRDRGHIGFLGHNDYVEFRNIRIGELASGLPAGYRMDPVMAKRYGLPSPAADNTPPPGFTALFNGKDLTNWKGLVADPKKRAQMSPAELAEAQKKADEKMRAHWKAENGVLVFDGKGDNLCTVQDYGNLEVWVDWKIEANGDSGIYLRGTPQVQIWDIADTRGNAKGLGSGGLFNNQKNPSAPLLKADKPVGEWNRFKIIMAGEKVHVFLNDQLVVNNTTLENYWERDKPIYPTGAIELQNHGNTLYFKNIYVRQLP